MCVEGEVGDARLSESINNTAHRETRQPDTDGQTHSDRHANRDTQTHTDGQTHRQTHRQTDRHTQTDTHRQTDTQTDRQTDRHSHNLACSFIPMACCFGVVVVRWVEVVWVSVQFGWRNFTSALHQFSKPWQLPSARALRPLLFFFECNVSLLARSLNSLPTHVCVLLLACCLCGCINVGVNYDSNEPKKSAILANSTSQDKQRRKKKGKGKGDYGRTSRKEQQKAGIDCLGGWVRVLHTRQQRFGYSGGEEQQRTEQQGKERKNEKERRKARKGQERKSRTKLKVSTPIPRIKKKGGGAKEKKRT